MQIQLESAKKIGRKIGINDDKGYALGIFLALIIVTALAISYFAFFRPAPAGYSTIYLLDSQNKAVNYPSVLVANQNSTFNVPVTVVNQMGSTAQYQILVKITDDLSIFPVNTAPIGVYNATLGNGQSWQESITVTENQVGSHSVVFELWQYNQDAKAYQFTNNECVLNIQVVS
ncbi:MAG: DUF1616 domain-containing protein [Candidatus Bathyarchaeia archaeon]|jgi:uncharacterized membrane protein